MTKQELDYIADRIFSKIMQKQEQYDREFKDDLEHMFMENVKHATNDTKREHLLGELARLHTMLAAYVENEQYEKANVLKRKIEIIENKLSKL
jgi:protein-arginine kinase activator protein McsA